MNLIILILDLYIVHFVFPGSIGGVESTYQGLWVQCKSRDVVSGTGRMATCTSVKVSNNTGMDCQFGYS